jgi:aquaporin Z
MPCELILRAKNPDYPNRRTSGQILPYVAAQTVGAAVGVGVLYAVASDSPNFDLAKGFASNGFAAHSPGQYSLGACVVAETLLTMAFFFVIMGAIHGKMPVGFAFKSPSD